MNSQAASPASSLFHARLLPFLRAAQNGDGGWGYRTGLRSAPEPTCAALLALSAALPDDGGLAALRADGCDWLEQSQLPDGGWPSQTEQAAGGWCTSLALLALLSAGRVGDHTERGVNWLLRAWPAEGGAWWRFMHWLTGGSKLVEQDFSLRGWGWTLGTASWVEPTSYAILALGMLPGGSHRAALRRRSDLGQAMLLNRVCPGGGWNSGNPVVYGVAGIPTVWQTSWALLALREQSSHPDVQASLDWLQREWRQSRGPASVALGHLSLTAHGRLGAQDEPLEPLLQERYERNEMLHDTLSIAWAACALSSRPLFIQSSSEASGGASGEAAGKNPGKAVPA